MKSLLALLKAQMAVRRHVVVAVLVCLVSSLPLGAESKVLWSCDTRASVGVKFAGSWQTKPEGWRKSGNGYRLDFTNLPSAKANTRLSFDIRCFGRDMTSRGAQHFGLYGVAGNEARFIIRSLYGSCMTASFETPSGTSMRRDIRNPFSPKFKFPFDSTNPPITHVEIDMREDSYALRLNGETVAWEKIAFPGVQSFCYQQHAADCALDNFRIEELQEEAPVHRHPQEAQPLSIPDDGRRVYPLARDAFSPHGGGFMFWFRNEPGLNRVSIKNAEGRELVGASFADVFCCVDIAKSQGGTWDFRRRLGGQGKGDWLHVAFTWRPDGTCRFFLNGLPYTPGFSAGEQFGYNILGNALKDPAFAEVMNVKHPHARRDRIQGFKIFARPVENHEVSADYRARMPIDAVLQDGLVESERPVSLTFSVAPAGYYTRPKPVDGPDVPATADLKLVLSELKPRHDDGRRPTRITGYDSTPIVTQAFGRVSVDCPKELALAPRTLKSGKYALSLVVNDGAFVKTRSLTAGRMPDFTSVPATDDEWRTVGAPIVSRTFARKGDFEFTSGVVVESSLGGTPYLESSGKLQTILDVPQEVIGHPLLLEIDWPDDKLRYAGFYLYPESQGLHRDRLQAGLLSGGEFKLTKRIQRQQYLVFCQTTNELFEARAMAKGMPVAVAAVRLYRLAEPLPRLKVNLPEGLRGRTFGFADEDQTFDNNFQSGRVGTLGSAWELMRYFAYTGQNAMSQLFFRYMMTLCPIETALEGMNMFPKDASELGALPRIFAANGCELWAQVSIRNIPEATHFDLIESDRRKQGFLFLDREGLDRYIYNEGAFRPNIANPIVRKAFADYCADYVNRYATNGVTTVAYNGIGPWPLDLGYDDWTFHHFLVETRTRPRKGLKRNAVTFADYSDRFDWLTATNGPSARAVWLRWRADRVTTWYAELAKAMTRSNPKLEIILGLPEGDDVFAEQGLDLMALAKIPNVRLGTPFRFINSCRWLHFRGSREAKDLKAEYARLHDFAAEDEFSRSRRLFGAAAMTIVGGQYHETYGNTLCPQRFGSVFQDADVKPWGRNWLRELTYAVAKSDTLALFTGQQPLGTLGHEREAREFAKAYRALPALPFADAASENPNVVVRTLATKNGTYLYCVNLSDRPQAVRPALFRNRQSVAAVDLSTGERVRGVTVKLKPYALRSFLK